MLSYQPLCANNVQFFVTPSNLFEPLRMTAMAYGAACLGLAGHSAFLAPRGEPLETGNDGVVLTFLSSEVAREAGGAFILAQAMAM